MKQIVAYVQFAFVGILLLAGCISLTTTLLPATSLPEQKTPLLVSPSTVILPSATLLPLPSQSAPPDAYLSETSGEVASRSSEQADFQPAVPPEMLWVGAQVRTGEYGRARLDLTSGTILRLPPRTLFKLQENRISETGLLTRIRLALGEIFVLLTGAGSVEVETDFGSAAVRGSYMLVSLPPEGGLVVQCLEGFCVVNTPAGELDLTGGFGVRFLPGLNDGTPQALQVFRLTDADFQRWNEEAPEIESAWPVIRATLTALPVLPNATLEIPGALPTIALPLPVTFVPAVPGLLPGDDDDDDDNHSSDATPTP